MIRFLQTEGPFKKIVLSGLLLLICAAMVIAFVPGNLGRDSRVRQARALLPRWMARILPPGSARDGAPDGATAGARYGAKRLHPVAFSLQQATQHAADQLMDRQALVAEAQRLGLKATPAEVKDELQHGRYAAIFFPGGTFIGQAEYEGMLQQHNLTTPVFEDSVGKEILISKLQAHDHRQRVGERCRHPQEFDKQNTKVKFDYAVLKQDDIRRAFIPRQRN
jgi:peptidyl-prolyl cis-trans isomerase D